MCSGPSSTSSLASGLLLLAGLIAACSPTDGEDARGPEAVAETGDQPGPREMDTEPEGPGLPPATLTGSRPYDSQTRGAVHGVVRVEGDVPERFLLGASEVPDCTHHEDVDHLSDVVVAQDGKLRFTYITLDSGYDEGDVPPPSAEAVHLNQRGCVYAPHVLGAQKGQRLVITNSDPTVHNVNVKARRNRSVNQTMAPGQDPLDYELLRSDTIRVKCDLHPWMFAWVHVSDHPWFAVSDGEGAFQIPEVPPGEYVLLARHETFGVLRGTVTVTAGQSTGVEFSFSAH